MIGADFWSTLLATVIGAIVGAVGSIAGAVISVRRLLAGQLEQARFERAAIREETALQAIRQDLPPILHRMEWILEHSGTGAELPDPYAGVRQAFDEVRAQWLTQWSGSLRDPGIRQLVETALAVRESLEAEGIRQAGPLLGAPVAEYLPRFGELAGELVSILRQLTAAIDALLMPSAEADNGTQDEELER